MRSRPDHSQIVCLAFRLLRRTVIIIQVSFIYLTVFLPSVQAISLQDAISIRAGFSTPDPNVSYDGPSFDAFKPFENFTSTSVLQVGSFTGSDLGGSDLDFFLLSEVAFYDGRIPGLGNSFGLLDSNGNFVSVIDPADLPGFSTSLFQDREEELSLALSSPEGLFSSIDQNNPDKAPHILAKEVTKAGQVTIPKTSLFGASLSFNLQVGDLVLFFEDLLATGNMLNNGVPGDFDYNDLVVVLREQPIPEPATALLLGAGLSALAISRRRRKQTSSM